MLKTDLKQAYNMVEETNLEMTPIKPSAITANNPRNIPITHAIYNG
ncbi:hypothetical protein [Winogradskyella sp. PC D3.3]